jgi:hypothetical protein
MDVMRCRILFLALAPLVLAGCTMLHSSPDPSYGGIAYYLPKSLGVAKVDLWKIPKQPGMARDEYIANIDMVVPPNQTEKPTRGVIVPDLKERYALSYSSNPFFYDRYCVLTDANSLLKSVEYATEDKTPQIVLGLAELGRKVGGFAGDRPADAREDAKPEASATVTFNPFDLDDRAAAEQAINATFNNRVSVRFEFPDLSHFRRNENDRKCRGEGGVCFRTLAKAPMRLWDAMTKKLTASVLVEVVNPYYTGHLDLERAFMVEKVQRLGFENGALSQVIMRKPSEALQTVKLPLAVVDAILAVPSNFIAKAAGTGGSVKAELDEQRETLRKIREQLDQGVAAPAGSIYQPSCNGGRLN